MKCENHSLSFNLTLVGTQKIKAKENPIVFTGQLYTGGMKLSAMIDQVCWPKSEKWQHLHTHFNIFHMSTTI